MPKVADIARVTTRDGTVWRGCARCGVLAALAPEVDQCETCAAEVASSTVDGTRALRSMAALLNEIPAVNASALERADWFARKADAFDAVAAADPSLAEEATGLAEGARKVAAQLLRGRSV